MNFFDFGLGELSSKLIDTVASYIPNENERLQAQKQIELLIVNQEHEINLAQIKNNQLEAQHKSIYVAGWRPFIGWVCGLGVAWAFVFLPVFSWLAVVCFHYDGVLPQVDILNLIALLSGMLGMGGLRTYDKKNLFKK